MGGGIHQLHNFAQRRAGRARELGGRVDHVHHLIHVAHIFAGSVLDIAYGVTHFLGGGHGFFCQLAHFVGHHGKSAPGLASTGRFNGGVKGQQIGLVGNIRNNTQYLACALGLFAKRGHLGFQFHSAGLNAADIGNHPCHHLCAALGLALGVMGRIRSLTGIAGHFKHCGVHLLHGGGCFAHAGRLTFRTTAGLLHLGGQFFRGRCHGFYHALKRRSRVQHALGLGVFGGNAGGLGFFCRLRRTCRFFLCVGALFVCFGYLGLEADHHQPQALCKAADFIAQIDGQQGVKIAARHARSKILQLPQGAHNHLFKRKQTDTHQCQNGYGPKYQHGIALRYGRSLDFCPAEGYAHAPVPVGNRLPGHQALFAVELVPNPTARFGPDHIAYGGFRSQILEKKLTVGVADHNTLWRNHNHTPRRAHGHAVEIF